MAPRLRETIGFSQIYTTAVSGNSQLQDTMTLVGGIWTSDRMSVLAGIFAQFRLHSVKATFLRGAASGEQGAMGFFRGSTNSQNLTTLLEVSELDRFAVALDGQTRPVSLMLSRAELVGPLQWYDCDQTSAAQSPGGIFVCTHTGGVATADTLYVRWEVDVEFVGAMESSVGVTKPQSPPTPTSAWEEVESKGVRLVTAEQLAARGERVVAETTLLRHTPRSR
jgi:hypothetical protein